MAKKYLLFSTLPICFLLLFSCRSEFETVRLSNDPALIYKKAKEFYEAEDWYKSQVLIEQVIPFYRGRPESEELFFKYANTFYNTRQYTTSAHWFQNFSNTYSNSSYREEADWLLAFSNYKMSPNFRLDQSSSDEAIEKFQIFANTYPQSGRISECNDIIDELRAKKELKSFNEGKLYYDLKHYEAAMKSFENTLIEFPETRDREEIRYLIVESSFQLADRSIYDKKLERFTKAIEHAESFLKKFSKSDYSDQVSQLKSISQKRIKALNDEH